MHSVSSNGCCSFSNMLAALDPFRSAGKLNPARSLNVPVSGRETMLNGKQGCQWCCEGLLPLCSYRREMCTLCPSNCCGSHKAEEFSSREQDRMQRVAGFKREIRVIEVIVSYEGNICRHGNIHLGLYSLGGNLCISPLNREPTRWYVTISRTPVTLIRNELIRKYLCLKGKEENRKYAGSQKDGAFGDW